MATALQARPVHTDFAPLFEPGRIGRMLLKNRIVMTPMGTLAEHPDGTVSDRAIDYYAERARGGVGMVITGGQLVTNTLESWTFGMDGVDTDRQTKAWRPLTDRVKAFGARICVQLSPGLGRAGFAWPGSARVFPSASAIPSFYHPEILTIPMTIAQIDHVVGAMGRAAARARIAGFDAIEIHGHVGYLLDQFMTPAWNHRTDEYGGSFENRMRIVVASIDAMRAEVGPDFPIIFRFCMDHRFAGGRTLEEGAEIIRYLETRGIDAFDINVGSYDSHPWLGLSAYFGDAPIAYAAAAARRATDKPILQAGNYTPEGAATALREGITDFISLGRSLLADPDWANKIKTGRREDVRPCIRCNEYCMNGVWKGMMATCAVNARASAERDYPLIATTAPKQIAVVGAGPAGLEAARIAATRGHHVDLYEQGPAIGGNLRTATGPYQSQTRALLDYYGVQMEKLGVTVHLDIAVRPASSNLVVADHVIVAVGSGQAVPDIPGIGDGHAMDIVEACLTRRDEIGRSIVIVGGDKAGCDAAIAFADEGRQVSIVEATDMLARSAAPDDRTMLQGYLAERGVRVLLGHAVTRFTAEGVTLQGPDGPTTLRAETVIHDFGRTPNSALADSFVFAHPSVTAVGDCEEIGVIGAAIRRGFFAAWAID